MTTDPRYPYTETNDLRTGPDLHPALLGLLPLIGKWRGTGKGSYANIEEFDYAQEVTFSHDGRDFLAYESRIWVIDADARPLRPYSREMGWWRPVGAEVSEVEPGLATSKGDEVEVLLTNPDGVAEIYVGKIDGTKIELVSDLIAHTASGSNVSAFHRLYGIVDGDLLYAIDMAASGHPLTPYLSARLTRIAG